jgi:hypothetical protein
VKHLFYSRFLVVLQHAHLSPQLAWHALYMRIANELYLKD